MFWLATSNDRKSQVSGRYLYHFAIGHRRIQRLISRPEAANRCLPANFGCTAQRFLANFHLFKRDNLMSRIAFLGLGAMGSRMAVHLVKAGHTVVVWNRSPAAIEPIAMLGAIAAASPREAVKGAEFVLSMVTDDTASESIWLTPGSGALDGMEPSAIVIEMSTVSANWINQLGRAARSRGLHFLDAPVSGSLPQAESAKLAMFVGGEEQVFERAKPVLELMTGSVHRIGPAGTGLAMKLAVNALLAIQVAAIAEAIDTLDRDGIGSKSAFGILSTLATASPASNWIGGLMVAEDFEPRFPISLVAKDLRYQNENIDRLGGKSPILDSALKIFESLQEQGLGAENISAAIKAYR
jgi:3-hydroxyisobutyrate dehydrogenase-like beta-hydroxyacid dehydrogenase